MKWGFTGTRAGMTLNQRHALERILHNPDLRDEFHHGDCIGADDEADTLAFAAGLFMHIHPPFDTRYRAFNNTGQFDRTYPTANYKERNQAIVNACDVLIAAPDGITEVVRSGTWQTIRMARRAGKPVILLEP